jgi:hypothetical protein
MQLKGTFQITDWKESEEKLFDDGGKLTTATVSQDYSGEIVGKSELKYQMYYEPNGNASFVGFEVIVGTIDDNPCELTLKHDGCFEAGIAKSQFTILNTCTDKKLIGIKGCFESGEGGQANFVIG